MPPSRVLLLPTLALSPVLAFAACGGSATPPVTPPPPAPVASAEPVPSVVEPPPAASSAAGPGSVASGLPERTPMPFCVLGRFGSAPRLFHLQDDELLMATSVPAAVCDKTGACALVPDGANPPADLALNDVIAAGGHWGRDVWMTSSGKRGEGTLYSVVHFAAGHWTRVARAERGYVPAYQQLATSPDGRVAGIASFQLDGAHATAAQIDAGPAQVVRLDELAGASPLGLPALRKGDTPFFLALTRLGGSLLVLDRAGGEEGRVVALRRGAAGTKEIALPLPGDVAGRDIEVNTLATSAGGVGFAGGQVAGVVHGYLARIDADKAASLDVPDAVGVISDVAVEPDENAWVLGAGGLFVRSPAGKWEHVTVAAEPGGSCTAGEVEVRAAGDVFVSARCDNGHTFVLRTRCPTAELPAGTP
jgi:hypothetical protein